MDLLLDAATGNGSGDVAGGAALAAYPVKNIWCWGTFDGCTATVEVSPDNSNWFDALDANGDPLAFTSKGVKAVDARAAYYRATVSSAGAETSVSCGIT
jgi:hypothetical protein